MAKKYLYGNLNQDTIRPNYGGSTTDSLVINVDNDKMIISGEVKWDAALGELAHKAYPGDKGARNYAKILELSAQLEEEIAKASKSRSTVETKVSVLETTVKALDTTLTTAIRTEAALASEADSIILNKCIAEAERAVTAEQELIEALKTEVTERQIVDAEIVSRLDALSGVSSSTLDEIRSLIVQEQTRATAAEAGLQNAIQTEQARSLQAEKDLDDSIVKLGKNIDLIQTDITKSIEDEVTARIVNDDLTTELIENESIRAQEVEETLANDISKLGSAVEELSTLLEIVDKKATACAAETLNTEVKQLEAEIADVRSEVSLATTKLTEDLEALETKETTDIEKVRNDLAGIVHDVSWNTDLVSKLSGKLKDINKHLSTLDVSLRDAQAATAYETTQRQTADAKIEKSVVALEQKLTAKDANVERQLTEFDDRTTTLVNSVQGLQGQLTEVIRTVELLNAADVVTKAEFVQLNEQLKTVYNNISGLSTTIEQEINRSIEQDNSHTALINELQTVQETNDYQFSQIALNIQSLIEAVRLLNDKVTVDNERDVELASTIIQLQAEVQELRHVVESSAIEYLDRLQAIVADLQIVDERVDLLQPQLDAFETTIQLIQRDIDKLTIDYADIVKEFERVDTTADAVNDRLSGLQDQVDTTTNRIDAELAEHRTALTKHDVSTHQHDVDIAALQESVLDLHNDDLQLEQQIIDVNASREADAELHLTHYYELVSRIEQEIIRAIAADEGLSVDTERNSGRITALQQDLTNVIELYVQEFRRADATLDDKITYEHITTEEYKTKLQSEIAEVAEEALQRDNRLQEQLEIINSRKDSVPLIENEGEYPELYAQQGDKTFTIPVEKAVVPEAVLRRDSVGNVLLSTDAEKFTTYSAVSKQFVENIVDELKKEISSISFDFIDGGNAPIG